MDITEIELDGRKFGIGRLTIGQLIEIQALQMTATSKAPAESPDDAFIRALGKRMINTLSIAMVKVAPEWTPEKITDLPMTMAELNAAYAAVLVHAGLIARVPVPGEAPTGETARP